MPLEFKTIVSKERLPRYEKSKQSDALYEWEAMVPVTPPWLKWAIPLDLECFVFILLLIFGQFDIWGFYILVLTLSVTLFLTYGVIGMADAAAYLGYSDLKHPQRLFCGK